MKHKLRLIVSAMLCLSVLFTLLAVNVQADVTITSNQTGTTAAMIMSSGRIPETQPWSSRTGRIQLLLE